MGISEEIKLEITNINKTVKNAIDATNEEVKKHGKIGAENSKKLENLTEGIKEATARILELEQQGTSEQDIDAAVQSVGAEFTDSKAFTEFQAGNTTKATFDAQNNLIVGSDDNVAPDRRSGVVSGPFRRLMVADALPSGNTTSNSIEYTRELLFTNAAEETQEGDFAYPQSDIVFELEVAPVRNIGHTILISKQMLEDAPTIASYVNGRMSFGVEFRKDFQILNGDGVGQNLKGLLHADNHFALVGVTAGDDQYTNIRRAIAQVALADYMAEVVFLNPADCADIDLLEGSDGHFISANPRMQNMKTIWGLPVIETNAMPVGRFLVGSMSMATQFTKRRGVILEMSDSNKDNFEKDMVTLKASARAALEIYRPASLVSGLLVGQ
jgi:HK97 family phage major capsid protein